MFPVAALANSLLQTATQNSETFGVLSHPPLSQRIDNLRPEIAGLYGIHSLHYLAPSEAARAAKNYLRFWDVFDVAYDCLHQTGIKTDFPLVHWVKHDDLATLYREDYRMRGFSIEISAIHDRRELAYTVHLEVTRACFIYPGRYQSAVVYQKNVQGLVSLRSNPRRAMLNSVQKAMDTFASDYKEANAAAPQEN